MLNGTLNLFIGLALAFGCVSLMVSTITEGLASALGWRAATLLTGMKALLNDPALDGLALDILNHAGANPLSSGTTPRGKAPAVMPSYIAPTQFAAAMIDSLQKAPGQAAAATATLRQSILDNVKNEQIQTLLLGQLARAGDDVNAFRQGLADWFDTAMARLSGRYKRNVQLVSFAIGLALAAALNVDAIRIAHVLWVQPDLAANVTVPDGDVGKATAYFLQNFPLGWTAGPGFAPVSVLGWLLTALATLFGAPFWFDTLQRFVQVRSSGGTPAEQKKDSA